MQTGSDDQLRVMALRLHAARRELAENRSLVSNAAAVLESRRRLLAELERFVAALEARKYPVPPALRDELALHQRLDDTRPR